MKKFLIFVLTVVSFIACSSRKNVRLTTDESIMQSSNLSSARYLHTESGLVLDFLTADNVTVYTSNGNSIVCTYIYNATKNEGRINMVEDGHELFIFKLNNNAALLSARQTGTLLRDSQDFLNHSSASFPQRKLIHLNKQ